ATLQKLGGGAPYRLVTRQETAKLFDDGEHYDGGMEPDGIYGNVLTGLTRFEGTYRFHARAKIEEPCPAEREAQWAINVELGIDADRTTVTVTDTGRNPDGSSHGTLVITPRDHYGSPLGPGRADQVPLSGAQGTTIGTVVDNGDGSYSVSTTWDPDVSDQPGVVVSQPDRPPVVVQPPISKADCPGPQPKPCALPPCPETCKRSRLAALLLRAFAALLGGVVLLPALAGAATT